MSSRRQPVGMMPIAIVSVIVWSVIGTGFAHAQAAAPQPVWSGSLGAGLAITSGNADTSNLNISATVTHDPDNPHLMKADALYLRGESNGDLNISLSTFGIRDDYSLSERTSLFGQFRHLHDTFKGIDYLIAPTVGVGHKLVITATTLLAVDAGVGAVLEKNPDFDLSKSGALTAGENFSHKLSDTATITQTVAALWKTGDFGDALYTIGVGLAANVTPRTALKVELLEVYKNKPPTALVQKQDVSLITSVVYAF